MQTDLWVLLDTRGCALHYFHSGTDKDADVLSDGTQLTTPGHTVQGFVDRLLLPALDIARAGRIIAVWDGGNEYRKTLYGEYKAHRADQHEELKLARDSSITAVKRVLAAVGVTQVQVAGVEADDVLAYFVKKLPGAKIIHTVDNDLLQLAAEPNVSVWVKENPNTDGYDRGDHVVPFHQVALYKSIVGDSSDGYKGIPGMGPKAWVKLGEAFGDDGLAELQEIISGDQKPTLEEYAGDALIDKLIAGYGEWRKSWLLATLHPELVGQRRGREFKLPQWYKRLPSPERLHDALAKADCLDLEDSLLPYVPQKFLVTGELTDDDVAEFAALAAKSPFVSFDIETWSPQNDDFDKAANGGYVDMFGSKVTGAGFTLGAHLETTFYFSFDHADTENLPKERLVELLMAIPPEKPLVIQNCLPGSTEVLTPAGWKRLDAVTTTDEVMQWDDKTGGLTFVHPERVITTTTDEWITWDSAFHHCSYTPNHRMYLKHHQDAQWRVFNAKEAATLHPNGYYLPVAGDYEPQQPLDISPEEARLLEAIRADGSYTGASVVFKFSKQRKVDRLMALVDRLGVSYSAKTYLLDRSVTYIKLYSSGCLAKLISLLGADKEYGLWVLNLSLAAREAIWDEVRFWDGGKHAHSSTHFVSTVREGVVDALQVLAHVSGKRFSASWVENNRGYGTKNAKPLAQVRLAPKQKTKLGHAPTISKVDKEPAYCLSVPTGAFMVRSNGKVHITGNCYFERTVLLNELGIDIGDAYDTKIMASHVDENLSSGLKDSSKHYLNYDQTHYGDVVEKGKTMRDYSAEHVFAYGADDPLCTAHLFDLYYLITNLEGTWEFIKEYEFPSVLPLSDGYLAGVTMDWDEVKRQGDEDQETLDRSIARLRELLHENQTAQDIEEGAANFIEEYKIGRSGDDATLLTELKDKITYAPLETKTVVKEWKPTPTSVKKVCEILGFEAPASLSKKAIEAWNPCAKEDEALAKEDFQAASFARLLGFCEPKMLTNTDTMELCQLGAEIMAAASPAKEVTEGTELNLDSPIQNQILLYGMLGLPIRLRQLKVSETRQKLGAGGSPQTDEDAIRMAMANDVKEGDWRKEALECLLAAKKAGTRCKLFYRKLPLWKHPIDGNIHPQFNTTGTETRRPTGSNPNFLQLPKKGEGMKVRRTVLPNAKLGHNCVVSIDWSQEELRIMAGLSGDRNLLDCYCGDNPKDVHSLTAIKKAKMTYEEFEAARKDDANPDRRRLNDIRGKAKNTVFGSQYGIGRNKLSRQMMEPVEVAQGYLDDYEATYPGVPVYRDAVIHEAGVKGYVDTLIGCRRHLFKDILHADDGHRSHAERQAVNYTIQGLAADYLKQTLARLHRRGTFQRTGAVLIAPIYDELAFSCHSSVAYEVITEVLEVMAMGIPGLPVPIIAEASIGPNFGDQHELGSAPSREEVALALGKFLELKEEAA